MDEVVVPLAVIGAMVAALVLFVLLFVLRRILLTRKVGAFDCSMRTSPEGRRTGWVLGVARYRPDRLDWFRAFAISPRPVRSLPRGALAVLDSRRPHGAEAYSVMPGAVVVRCEHAGTTLELAMSKDAYTGFSSWLESAPPGQNVNVA